MPEGPEVFNIAKQLDEKFKGAVIDGHEILSVYNHGKKVVLKHDDGYIVFSLGMTGKVLTHQGVYPREVFETTNGNIYFDDQRKFGRVDHVEKDGLEAHFKGKVGRCWIANRPSLEEFKTVCQEKRRSRSKLCPFMLNQSVFSGIGNYIKADSLYLARIDPSRALSSLSDDEFEALYNAVCQVLDTSMKEGGHTLRDYVDSNGEKGGYKPLVYGRKKDDSGNDVVKQIFTDGRTTHWVKEVQK